MKTSHSALETYARCGEQYRLKYLVKDPEILKLKTVPEHALVLGSLVHEALDAFYRHDEAPITWLQRYWNNELEKYDLGKLADELDRITQDLVHLDDRCTENYEGPDPIRSQNGDVYSKPKASKAYQQAYAELKLEERRILVDQQVAAAAAPDSSWLYLPVSAVYSESTAILRDWKSPKLIKTALAVEKAFNAQFQIRTEESTFLTGKIDLICTTVDGKLMIVDHKTSKGDPPPDWKVAMNDQLLLYAWMHLLMTGDLVDLIAIHHVRTGRLVAAPFDMTRAEQVVQRHEHAVRGIQSGIFIAQNPVNYIQNCYNNGITCPFLGYCHPDFVLQAGLLG